MPGFSLPPGIVLPLPPEVYAEVMKLPAGTAPPGTTETGIQRPYWVFVRGWSLLAVALFIMTAAVGIRLFTRWHLPKRWQVEDYVMGTTWAVFVAYIGLSFKCGSEGIDFHMWNLTVGMAIQSLKWLAIAGVLFIVLNALIKVAILLQYLRVFVPKRQVNQPMFFACWVMMFVVVAFYVILLGLEVGECTPWEKIWNPLVPGYCVVKDTTTLAIAAAWMNVATDAAILILPLPCIFRLKMEWKKKLGISSLFLAGIIACVLSSLRLYYTYVATHSTDATYYFGTLGFFALYEMCSGALVLCLPTFPKFLSLCKNKLDSIRGTRRQGSDVIDGRPVVYETKAFAARRPAAINSLGLSSVDQYMGRGANQSIPADHISTSGNPNESGSLNDRSGSDDVEPKDKNAGSSVWGSKNTMERHDEPSSYV